LKRGTETTLAEYDLSLPDWHVLSPLRLASPGRRHSPGSLAADHELSSGAMTSRLDRLEEAGLVRRPPDPDDRRGVLVELTDAGGKAWKDSVAAQAAKESLVADALTKDEKRQLNALLRRLMREFERREQERS